jgi:hypothetical protein
MEALLGGGGVLLCTALPARAAAGGVVVPGGSALPFGTTHEKPVPQKTISGSLLAARIERLRQALLLWRSAQIVINGTGRRALGARGVAVDTALLRAFARDWLASRGPWHCRRGVPLLLTLMLILTLAARGAAVGTALLRACARHRTTRG